MQNINLPVVTTQPDEQHMSVQITGARYRTLEDFTRFMNKEPEKNEIFINKMAANSKYIPIGIIQTKLDEVFAGMWQTSNFRYTAVANELCGTITLEFFHPVSQMWMKREGSAAVMIRQNSGADITDLKAKLKNGLTMDVPHLQSSCLAAAARTLGKVFGRDMNRKAEMTSDYDSIYSDMADQKAVAESSIKDAKTSEDLGKIYNGLSEELKEMPAILRAYRFRASQLKANGGKAA